MEPRNESRQRVGGGCARPELAALLTEWDALEAGARAQLSKHASECPSCGPRLALLRRAQAWLEQASAVTTACPSADELYDFGRGPGARALSETERANLEAHVTGCAECGALVATLASKPPVPLIAAPLMDPDAPAELAPGPAVGLPRRRWRALVWIPLAAAAALALTFIWPRESSSHAAIGSIRFPAQPVLRGAADDALLFPRDRVLRGADGLFASPLFELAPRERATSYRIDVFAHAGGAFDAGSAVATWSSPTPLADAPVALARALVAGHFTWEAWAVVDGLDVYLGRRDFEVQVDARLVAEIDARRAAPEPTRSESILHLLHDAGFVGDARAFARLLPPSPERDAYLARLPGR